MGYNCCEELGKRGILPADNIVGSGVDFLEPQPPPPPPPEFEHFCSSCRRQIIDGRWTCCCRGMHTFMMVLSLGASVAVMAWALCRVFS